jgi:aspartate ammonia-lyase
MKTTGAATRVEHDLLGEMELPPDCPWGIHTERARNNFPLLTRPVHPSLLVAYLKVKQACCRANREQSYLPSPLGESIEQAITELLADFDPGLFPLDALQGGAGTSLNMNLNEVIARRAQNIMDRRDAGNRVIVSPLDHVNLHQSTNDTFPTALKVAAIANVRETGRALAQLQGALQGREQAFARIPALGRTELMPAAPMLLGAQFGAMAEAVGRDRWRTAKCEERLRVVNLGGTAIGTGMAAPQPYIFLVIEKLRELTGMGLARGENLPGETAHADAFVEVSGILKAAAVNFHKLANDLRLLHAAREINLPPVQAGSSLMPGKVNPVMCEWAIAAAIQIKAHDLVVTDCAALGTHQIVEFLPSLAASLLAALDLIRSVALRLASHIGGITANPERCLATLDASDAIITALVPVLGYVEATAVMRRYRAQVYDALPLRAFLENEIGAETVVKALAPQSLNSLGYRDP